MTKNKKKSTINYKYIYIFIIILIFLLLAIPKNATLTYNFENNADFKKWKTYNSLTKKTKNSISLNKIKRTAVLFNQQKKLQSLKWQNTPYVKLVIKPENLNRKISLIWSPTKSLNKNYQRVVDVPANKSTIIINTAQNIPWQRSFGWINSLYGNTQINSFGFFIPQQYNGLEINSIELLSSLSIFDYIKLIIRELSIVEPVKVSSINAQYGISILGTQLAYFFGVILVLLAMPLLINFNKKNNYIFIIGVAIVFLLYDITINQTLLNSAKYASNRSAWYVDKYQEYRSRFGEQFAILTREFEKQVPYGSKVHFPISKDNKVQGESNWIAFQYYGLYNVSDIKDADYIFYYYPKVLQFDNNSNIVKADKKQYSFSSIVNITEYVQILRVIK